MKPRFGYDIATEGKEEAPLGPSKTRVKGDMDELRDLGLALLDLPHERFARIDMNEGLRDAFNELARITNLSARKRQASYIGKLLRLVDTSAFEAELAAFNKGREQASRGFPDVAKWRDRLLADDAAFTEWCAVHPGGDLRLLRNLIRNARKEETEAAAEAAHTGITQPKGRHYRALFQHLRAVAEAARDAL